LDKAAVIRRRPPLVLIDTTSLFNWQEFRAVDADTRERLRREYAEREIDVLAAYDVPTPTDPLAVSAIHVRCHLPDAEAEWRFDETGDEPTRIARPDRTPDEQARLDRYRETGEWGDETADEPVAEDIDELDSEPWGAPSETLYVNQKTGFPVSRREHQALRATRRGNDQHRADQRRHVESTRRG